MGKEIKFHEIYVATIGNENSYTLVHSIRDSPQFLLSSTKTLHRIDYDKLNKYLKGVSFYKTADRIQIYNGIPQIILHCLFLDNGFSCVNKDKLEKILLDSGLGEHKEKIKNIF